MILTLGRLHREFQDRSYDLVSEKKRKKRKRQFSSGTILDLGRVFIANLGMFS